MDIELTRSAEAPVLAPSFRYAIITPVRDEAKNFHQTIDSVISQTHRPNHWIIVDDGSSDQTGSIAEAAAAAHSWIRVIHRKDRGSRRPGTGVMEAFSDGLAQVGDEQFDFLVKLDGDLAFAPDYFQRCFGHFERNPVLGIAGGLICRKNNGTLVADSAGDPPFHVRGATKIYRRACWEQIGGLISMPGWDTVDELKANMLGWKTRTFVELRIHQLKDTGSADGNWINWVKNGRANYVAGYHPLFMAAKCARRIFSRPYVVAAGALAWGFLSSYLRGSRKVDDTALIKYLRHQQIRRLTARTSIWT